MHAVVFDDLAPRRPAGAMADPDRCPGTLRLHEAADGWLARVRIPGGRVSSGEARVLADAADTLGSGLIDLTSRANVQLRGLEPDAAAALSRALTDAGLLPSRAHERVRNVLASPLAGRDPRALVDGALLTAALDRAICAAPELAALSGRFQFAVEDGSGLMAGADADILLAAVAPDEVELVRTGERMDVTAGPAAAVAAARAFLARGDGAWRMAPHPVGTRGHMTPMATGSFLQADGRVAVTALVPLGRLDAGQLRGLAALAPEIRVSPWRTVTLIDIAAEVETSAALLDLGLILDPDSGWRGLTACAGVGACPRARLDVRAAAHTRAAHRHPGDPAEHWSACPRRCGLPRGEVRAVTWTEAGIDVAGHTVPDLSAAVEALA